MALGTFTPPARANGKAGSFDPRFNTDKPLIVVVREFRENFTTQRFPNPKDVVIYDVVDLLANTVQISVITGSGAIVDRLKPSVPADGAVPEKLPVVFKLVSPAGGNPYCTVEPLEGQALQLAIAWDAKNPTRIEDERAAKMAADAAQAPAVDPVAAALQGLGQAAPAAAPLQGIGQTAAPAAAAPAMSDADLEAAIKALG